MVLKRAAYHLCSRLDLDRERLAGDEGLVDRRAGVRDYAVDGDPLTGAGPHHLTDLDLRDGHPDLGALAQHPGPV